MQPAFDQHYYRHDCGVPYERNQHWLEFFGAIADNVIREFAPASVLDVGCAMGFLVEALRRRGVEAWGVDVSEYAISRVDEAASPYCAVSSATDDLPGHFPETFDLVTCIEVVEHLPAEGAQAAIANLARWGRRVLFSSSPHDYEEATHLTVLPAEEWAAMFARDGLVRDFDADCSFLTAWAVLYDHAPLTVPLVVKRYERRFSRYLNENQGLRQGVLRLQGAMADIERASDEDSVERARLEQELGEAKSQLSVANERAEQAEAHTTAAVTQFHETHAELERLRVTLSERAEQTEDLRRHYEGAIHARDAAEAALAGLSARAGSDRDQIADLVAGLDQLRERYAQTEEQLSVAVRTEEQLRVELHSTRARLDDVLASRTWRIGRAAVSPLSRVKNLLSRRPAE